jgi:hypothetical protein
MTGTISAGTVQLADDLVLTRMGYGAMQLAGPMVWGPPKDRDAAKSVLSAAVDLGITHIDTSDYYGPHTVNELIREALHPYPAGLHIVTKIGARRGPDKSWPAALSRDELVQAVHDNLEHLGLESLDLVNLRMTDSREAAAITGPFAVLAGLQREGLIRHLGVSNASAEQVAAAQSIAPVVAVQNFYNLAARADDALVDQSAPSWASRSCRSSRSAGSGRCSPPRWTRSPSAWASPACKSPWPGCCNAPRRSCSSPAHPASRTCGRTPARPTSNSPPKLSRHSTRSAPPTASPRGSGVDHPRWWCRAARATWQ